MANYVQPTIGAKSANDAANSAALVPALWAKEIAANRVDNLVLWSLIDSRYSSEIANKGDVLLRKLENILSPLQSKLAFASC